MPDDMIAASRAKAQFKSIGFIGSAPEKERSRKALSQAGADYIIESFDELKNLVAIG
jgi:phosphoglycolate phosphatase-like HAD superfamily hydrolase